MRREYGHHLVNGRYGSSRRQLRAADHENRNGQHARGGYFRVSGASAGVLRQHAGNIVRPKQDQIIFRLKWPARANHRGVRKRQVFKDWIDNADHVMMLRRGGERSERQSPKTRKNSLRSFGQSRHRIFDARKALPSVAGLRHPCGAFKRDQRNVGVARRLNGVSADTGGERVRRIDDDTKTFIRDKASKAHRTTEAADAHRQSFQQIGLRRPARQRQHDIEAIIAVKNTCQVPRFTRPAEQQNAGSFSISIAHASRP